MFEIIWRTIKKPSRIIPAGMIGFVFYAGIVLLPHLSTIQSYARGESFGTVLNFIIGLLQHSESLVGTWPAIMFAILVGGISINTALIIELLALQKSKAKESLKVSHVSENTLSFLASLFTIFGYGCAACGTAISSTIFSTIGLSVIATWLPFRGLEFSIIGLFCLVWSWYILIKKIKSMSKAICIPPGLKVY